MMALTLGSTLSFTIEEFYLPGDIPAIAAEGAVGADHPMAGHQAHHRVGADSLSHRTGRLRAVNSLGDILVSSNHADGDCQQITPHRKLERGAVEMKTEAGHLVVTLPQQQYSMAMRGHSAATEPCPGEMPFKSLHRLPLHRGRHEKTDALVG